MEREQENDITKSHNQGEGLNDRNMNLKITEENSKEIDSEMLCH